MAVDAWGFDSERQAKAHRLRRMRFRLSIVRSAAIIVLVVGLVAVGSASLRDAVASFRWPSWASTILFLVLVSAILGFLAPVLLVPLFYRFRPLADAALRRRFEALAAKAKVPILGVFELRASEKTRRSNAAVMGLGPTRRVIVTDTLVTGFTPEEVETVLAHELAHQKYRDPIRGFVSGSLVSLLILFAVSWVYASTYTIVGIRSVADMAGLPFLVAVF